MMTAEFRGESSELTNQQKFHNLRRKMIIEVRLISHAGAGEKWHEAVIKDTNKEGAYCQLLNSPGQRFWHWRDVRPCIRTELPRQTATLAEVAELHSPPPELPRREPMPPPPALTAAIVPRSAPPIVTLVRTPPPPPPPPVPGEDLRDRPIYANPTESAVGGLVRPARLRANLSQSALAERVAKAADDPGFTNKRLSSIETGLRAPSEAEQLALVDVLQIDLTALIAACGEDEQRREQEKKKQRDRARAQAQRLERAAEQGRTIIPRSSIYRPAVAVAPEAAPEAVAPAPAPALSAPRVSRVAPRGQRIGSVEDLVEELIGIVALPVDADMRRAWFRCARELFRLSWEK